MKTLRRLLALLVTLSLLGGCAALTPAPGKGGGKIDDTEWYKQNQRDLEMGGPD